MCTPKSCLQFDSFAYNLADNGVVLHYSILQSMHMFSPCRAVIGLVMGDKYFE